MQSGPGHTHTSVLQTAVQKSFFFLFFFCNKTFSVPEVTVTETKIIYILKLFIGLYRTDLVGKKHI